MFTSQIQCPASFARLDAVWAAGVSSVRWAWVRARLRELQAHGPAGALDDRRYALCWHSAVLLQRRIGQKVETDDKPVIALIFRSKGTVQT